MIAGNDIEDGDPVYKGDDGKAYSCLVRFKVGKPIKPGHMVALTVDTQQLEPYDSSVHYAASPMFIAVRNMVVGESISFSHGLGGFTPRLCDGVVKGQCSGVTFVAPTFGVIAPVGTAIDGERLAIGFDTETGEIDLPKPAEPEAKAIEFKKWL